MQSTFADFYLFNLRNKAFVFYWHMVHCFFHLFKNDKAFSFKTSKLASLQIIRNQTLFDLTLFWIIVILNALGSPFEDCTIVFDQRKTDHIINNGRYTQILSSLLSNCQWCTTKKVFDNFRASYPSRYNKLFVEKKTSEHRFEVENRFERMSFRWIAVKFFDIIMSKWNSKKEVWMY